jgi:hypothetical protein
MAQWYISKYARLLNGEVELLSYTKAANFDVACGAERINLPNNQFYHAENRVGSMLPRLKLEWIARERYSHKAHVAQMQVDAEYKAQHILRAEDVDFASTMRVMQVLKPLLIKAQYDLVLQSLMRKPSVMQYLYENK